MNSYIDENGNRKRYWEWSPQMSKEEWQKKNHENWDAWEKANRKVKMLEIKTKL